LRRGDPVSAIGRSRAKNPIRADTAHPGRNESAGNARRSDGGRRSARFRSRAYEDRAVKTRTNANELEQNLIAVTSAELQTVTGGSIDLDVPQCGTVIPHFPYPQPTAALGSIVTLPAVQ
jgi:hypothetical protein